MAESILVSAASVAAGQSCAVVAYEVPPGAELLTFRTECDQPHGVRFYGSDATFDAVASAAIYDAETRTPLDATAGDGDLRTMDPGGYAFVACVVTNNGAVPATVTVAVQPAYNAVYGQIGAGEVTVTSPVAASGAVTVYAGDDYDAAHGRSINFAVADAAHGLSLDTAVVTFKSTEATWTATGVVSTADGYTVTFEPTAAQTGALSIRPRQRYKLEATLSDDEVVTLATGWLTLVRDIPAQ